MKNGCHIREEPMKNAYHKSARWMITVNGKEWEQLYCTREEMMNVIDRVRYHYPNNTLRVFSEVNTEQKTMNYVTGFHL